MQGESYSQFHEIDGLGSTPDYYGISNSSFGAAREGPVAPTTLTNSQGQTIELPTFEFGLVLAGAVSAGAYTAGVVDYMIEILDRWEAAKQADFEAFGTDFARWSVPPHAVRLRAVAGASAGSIVGATLCTISGKTFPSGAGLSPAIAPQTPHPPGKPTPVHENPFYNAWVRQPDIRAMLQTGDIDNIRSKPPGPGEAELPLMRLGSLLNVAVLDRVADQTVTFAETAPAKAPARRWLDLGVRMAFTIGNLHGIPYRYRMVGLEGADFATTRHADLFRFTLTGTQGPAGATAPPDWRAMADAALASSAFPGALQARWMDMQGADTHRHLQLDMRFSPTPGIGWAQPASAVAGYVNSSFSGLMLHYAAADGGTMNNQPYAFVRQALAGPMGHNPREGDRANRAVVLIDPFPAAPLRKMEWAAADPRAVPKKVPLSAVETLVALFGAYKAQARYDANDLLLATDANVYSRYMLSPMRADPAPGSTRTLTGADALASGGLGAFAGFLSESFRHHDFLMGRRNAENFLRNYFALPPDNPLFAMPVVGAGGGGAPTDFGANTGTATQPASPYWTITCDGSGHHERQILPVPFSRSDWPGNQPQTGMALDPAMDAARREAMLIRRKLAVRRLLRCPTPVWPDPAGVAAALAGALRDPIGARVRALVELGLDGIKLGCLSVPFNLGLRNVAVRTVAGRITAAIGKAIVSGLKQSA